MAGKPLVTSTDYGVQVLVSKLSHNLLADLVILLLRERLGRPEMDGEMLCRALVQNAASVADLRRDRLPVANIAELDLLVKVRITPAGSTRTAMVDWLKNARGISA